MTPNRTVRLCEKCGCVAAPKAHGLCHHHYYAEREKTSVRKAWQQRYDKTARRTVRRKANATVNNAIKRGHLERKPCEVCGEKAAAAHHDSYLPIDWLNVRWLCAECHADWHDKNDPIYPNE